MNLLLITPYLEQKKGPFIWAKNFLENYTNKKIHVLTFDENIGEYESCKISTHQGFKIERKILGYPFLSLTPSIVKVEKKMKIDIVQTNDTLVAFCALIARKITGVPVVLRMGGEYYTEIGQWGEKLSKLNGLKGSVFAKLFCTFFERIGKYTMKRVDKLVSVNSYMHDYLLKYGFESVVIPNAVDIKKYASLKDFDSQFIDILTICNLAIHKKVEGLFLLFDCIDLIKNSYPDIKVKIAGDGPYKEDIIQIIREKGLDKNVEILGYRSDIPYLLNSSKIYVHSSLQDVSPNSILEAMASRKPIVCVNVGGISEILTDGYNGLICDANSNDLKLKIIYLIENENIRSIIGSNALKTVREQFSWENVVEKYMMTYDDVLSDPKVKHIDST